MGMFGRQISTESCRSESELEDLLAQLTELENGAERSEPIYVRVFQLEGDRAPDGVFEQFVDGYEQMVQFVASYWGSPAFAGTWETPGFPEWHHWVARLAVWNKNGRQIYIECDQPDNELPISIAIGARSE